jgi:hypothetical protein
MKTIGYMEGTNPEILTELFIEGHETVPLSNGIDNHGKNIILVTYEDGIDLIVGYLHKFIPLSPRYKLVEILSSARVNEIPVIFIVPEQFQEKAHQLLSDKKITYKLADPKDLLKIIFESLSD